MSDQEDKHYNETMQAAEDAIAHHMNAIDNYEIEIAKAYNRGYRSGLRDGKEEGVKAIEKLMEMYNENYARYETALSQITKGD
jgi:flagellar biosynthesis/type III secretory pathway protein FliH